MNANAELPVVVVGVDGSPASGHAVQWAAHYASATGGCLRIVTAWNWPRMYGIAMVVDGVDLEAAARDCAEKAAVESGLDPDRVRTEVVEGVASDALIALSSDADLLVVGSHGDGPIGRALLGSVSNDCVHHAPVPVVIVR